MWEIILKLFGMDSKSIQKREGLKKYAKTLDAALTDLKLDDIEKEKIDKLIKLHGLEATDLMPYHRAAFQKAFDTIVSDSLISEDEHARLNDILNYLNIGAKEFAPNQERFNRARLLYEVEQGRLPNFPKNPTGVILKDGEILHYAAGAALIKRKRQAEKINYSGITASIRIAKGISLNAPIMSGFQAASSCRA